MHVIIDYNINIWNIDNGDVNMPLFAELREYQIEYPLPDIFSQIHYFAYSTHHLAISKHSCFLVSLPVEMVQSGTVYPSFV
jgi:hypothetical protein